MGHHLIQCKNRLWVQEGVILGFISFFVAWVVLAFFSGILLDIVDSTYLCYAIDKDTQSITKPDIHEIYSKVVTWVLLHLLLLRLACSSPCL